VSLGRAVCGICRSSSEVHTVFRLSAEVKVDLGEVHPYALSHWSGSRALSYCYYNKTGLKFGLERSLVVSSEWEIGQCHDFR
jgi:hypothetical protein